VSCLKVLRCWWLQNTNFPRNDVEGSDLVDCLGMEVACGIFNHTLTQDFDSSRL